MILWLIEATLKEGETKALFIHLISLTGNGKGLVFFNSLPLIVFSTSNLFIDHAKKSYNEICFHSQWSSVFKYSLKKDESPL